MIVKPVQGKQIKELIIILMNRMLFPYGLIYTDDKLIYRPVNSDLNISFLITSNTDKILKFLNLEDLSIYFKMMDEITDNLSIYESVIYSNKFNKNVFKTISYAAIREKYIITNPELVELYRYMVQLVATLEKDNKLLRNTYMYPKDTILLLKVLEKQFGITGLEKNYLNALDMHKNKKPIEVTTQMLQLWVPYLQNTLPYKMVSILEGFKFHILETGWDNFDNYAKENSIADIRTDFMYYFNKVRLVY